MHMRNFFFWIDMLEVSDSETLKFNKLHCMRLNFGTSDHCPWCLGADDKSAVNETDGRGR